jgi:hypothetical protein
LTTRLDVPQGDKYIPTDVSSIDHRAILMFPLELPDAREWTIFTNRIIEKQIMIIPREKIAPIPSFCLKDTRRPIRRRIGSTPGMTSVAISMLVATQIALIPLETEQASERKCLPYNVYLL